MFISKIQKLSLRFLNVLATIILSITLIISLQYYHTEIFNKEINQSFSGDHLYNPYEDYDGSSLKANFHAHSVVWMNITNGAQQPEEIYEHYYKKGYDIISLSNYHKITIDKSADYYIPAYEHGYNFKKSHQLVINSNKENFFDFSGYQSFHNKQLVLKKLKTNDNLVALAHPNFMAGYTKEDVKYLRGYDFIEVYNNYRTSAGVWDAALSSGYPAWILADDDVHDISNPDLCFNNWTRIGTEEKTKTGVLSALKRGCHYGVKNATHNEINFLDSCKLQGHEIKAYFRSKADSILFISDNGKVVNRINGQKFASYSVLPENSYVRIEAHTGEETIALNPVIRYNGIFLTKNAEIPDVNILMTILYRTLVLFTSTLFLFLLILLHRKNKLIDRVFRSNLISKIRI